MKVTESEDFPLPLTVDIGGAKMKIVLIDLR